MLWFDNRIKHVRCIEHYQKQESQEENLTWLSPALEIDQIGRALISFCLAQGVKDTELSKDPWLKALKD
jgi:hypothetical protein